MIQVHALVVDDSGVMRKMVMKQLGESGLAEFTFEEAGDGVQALEKFDPEKIDIVFADWNMPNMSGIDLLAKIRKNKEGPRVPVVMITSEKTMGKIEEALDRGGADAYVVKPFTAMVLRRKLKGIFDDIEDAQETAEEPQKKKGGLFARLTSKNG